MLRNSNKSSHCFRRLEFSKIHFIIKFTQGRLNANGIESGFVTKLKSSNPFNLVSYISLRRFADVKHKFVVIGEIVMGMTNKLR